MTDIREEMNDLRNRFNFQEAPMAVMWMCDHKECETISPAGTEGWLFIKVVGDAKESWEQLMLCPQHSNLLRRKK
jgi:hypothetical protein